MIFTEVNWKDDKTFTCTVLHLTNFDGEKLSIKCWFNKQNKKNCDDGDIVKFYKINMKPFEYKFNWTTL